MAGTNLGDSGYALFHVREDDTLEMYFRSESQQHMHNFPFQCGTSGDDPTKSDYLEHEFKDGDVVLIFSDGFHDNVFDSGFPHCVEEYLYDGLVTSLSAAADCLAKKAYWLGKNTQFRCPWMIEMKRAVEAGEELPNGPVPEGFSFEGGKHDDITVTVAQVFTKKEGEPRKGTAAADTYFPDQKTIYTGAVPLNKYDSMKRARFHKPGDQFPEASQ